MSPVSQVSATPSLANMRESPAARAAHVTRTPPAEAAPVPSTKVTLGQAPSPDYTDRIQRRPRVSVEALLAGSGHSFRAGGLNAAVPGVAAATSQLTYSFSPQVGAATALDAEASVASNEQQQAAMRAMVYLSSMMNVRFVEVAMGGQISFGGAVLPPAGGGGGGAGGGAVDPASAAGPVPAPGATPSAAPAPSPTPSPAPRPAVASGMGLV